MINGEQSHSALAQHFRQRRLDKQSKVAKHARNAARFRVVVFTALGLLACLVLSITALVNKDTPRPVESASTLR